MLTCCSDDGESESEDECEVAVSEFTKDLSAHKSYTANWSKNYCPLVGALMFEYSPKHNANKETGNPGWAEYIACVAM